MHPQSVAEEEEKTEITTEGMEISTRSKDMGSTERVTHKRKMPSPSHSSNGHSSAETSPSPIKKKKKPGAVSSTKDQSELRHGPFYYVKQPALTTDPVDVVPQDGRNDFYCWLCHREGQVLCCELCPRVYHAKCLKLPAEPEGDWFCPECEKITVAECIETQSKAMMMLTIEQLSYLLKFALQKMKQPGDHPRLSSRSPHAASTQRKTFNWTEPFQKPVSLEQHPDYAEYIFHPMDLCTLEKNIKKKMYGCTEAFLADAKWILHNCIIYNGGNHKLTATAKVIVKICEHEMNEIEVCPECYLSACQKRDNWFCEPCSNPHPLVWAKLKGFPFWPAKALRDKDGQVDARFFGQHDRAWVPLNNCYLMSKEIPFSVKKTKSIFNSAMQEMEVYVENMKKKFGVFNYAPFRTPYTPDNNFQMLLDPSNPSSTPIKPEKQEKIKLSFDMTASPKIPLARTMLSGTGVGGSAAGRRLPLSDMPRSPMSTNSSAHTGSDGETETADKSQTKAPNSQYSTGEESMDCAASPAHPRPCPAGSSLDSPKPFHSPGVGELRVNLKRVFQEEGLLGYDPSLGTCIVHRDSVSHLAQLDRATADCTLAMETALHVTSCQDEFRQQQIAVLWRASGATHTQRHLVCGPVKTPGSHLTAAQYLQLRRGQMKEASEMKYGDQVEGQTWDDIIRVMTSATVRFELLSTVHTSPVTLDVQREGGVSTKGPRGGVFVMYNCARLHTLFDSYERGVEKGLYPEIPEGSQLDFSALKEEGEWLLLFNYLIPFSELLDQSRQALDCEGGGGARVNIKTEQICKFLVSLSKDFSSYYNRVHVLGEPLPHLFNQMFCRLHLLRALRELYHSALDTLNLPPIRQL